MKLLAVPKNKNTHVSYLKVEQLQKIEVDGITYELESFMGGDWKFMAMVTGIDSASCAYSCLQTNNMQLENGLYQIPLKENGPHARSLRCHSNHVHGSSMFLADPYSGLSHWITCD